MVMELGLRIFTCDSSHPRLLEKLKEWLLTPEEHCFAVFHASPPDLPLVNHVLVAYGAWLFKEGKPFFITTVKF